MGTMLAAGTTTAIDSTAWAPVMEALTAQVSVSSVIGVIASVVGAGIGLVFMWWGVRKAAASLMKAFKNGKFSF